MAISLRRNEKGKTAADTDGPPINNLAKGAEESYNIRRLAGIRSVHKELVLPAGVEPTREVVADMQRKHKISRCYGPNGEKYLGNMMKFGLLKEDDEDASPEKKEEVVNLMDDGVPIPESGERRLQHRSRPMKRVEDVMPTGRAGGRGRGRFRQSRASLNQDSDTASVTSTSSVLSSTSTLSSGSSMPSAKEQLRQLVPDSGFRMRSSASVEKKEKQKLNGRFLFIKVLSTLEEVSLPLRDLMELYDDAWKAMSQKNREFWKTKAKILDLQIRTRGSGDGGRHRGGGIFVKVELNMKGEDDIDDLYC